MKAKHLRDYSPLFLAEVRLAREFLGESAAVELYGADAVAFAAATREGRPTARLGAALFGRKP